MPLDIFSKKKDEKERQKITIDYREKNSLVPAELASLGCSIKFEQLPIGDYISGEYIIERKTLSDLQSSILDKRIFAQIESLKTQSNPILIVERGNYAWSLHENVLKGVILSSIRSKVPVIVTENEKDTAKYLVLLGKENKTSSFSFRPHKKVESKEKIISYILEGFPSIRPTTAKKLLDKFKSIRNIINAKEEEIKEILGKKYNKFKEIID